MRALIAILLCAFTGVIAEAAEPNLAGRNPLDAATGELLAGRTEAALALLDAADKLGAPGTLALDLRGCAYLEQRKFEEAIAAFRAAHEKDPAPYAPQLHLGDVLLREKKWEEARAVYEEMLKGTNILVLNERLRYALLLTYLGAKDDTKAKTMLEGVVFPTESPCFYYAQAAWSFAHGDHKAGLKWMKTAREIFDDKKTAWFARPLYEMGWIKTKPPLALE